MSRRAQALVRGSRTLINGLMDLLVSDKLQPFKQVDNLERRMDAHETVLKAYKYFGEADMENLATLYHDDYVFYMNGMHRLSGQYHGFGDWASNCLAKIPQALPNFNLEVLTSFSDGSRVFVHARATADGLDAYFGHYAVVEDGKIKEFHVFDDSQKVAHAMKAVI